MTTTATTPETAPRKRLKLSAKDRRILDSTFSIDSRALAAVRILLAGLILFQSFVIDWSEPRDPSSLAEVLGQYGPIIVIPFATMMLLGWNTRLAVMLTWVTYSLSLRADLVVHIPVDMGYYILNITLFWCMFLPLGRHLSLDARGSRNVAIRFLSVASAALIFQVFIIYFSAGLYKNLGEWIFEATAMKDILSNDAYQTGLGRALLDYPLLLVVMSVVTVVVEVIGSLLVIVPGRSLQRRRVVIVPLFIGLHVGIAVLMGLGLFPYVMMAVWLLFLPSAFWDRLWKRFKSSLLGAEEFIDSNRWRNGVAGVFVIIAAVSNVLTWMYYPDFPGLADDFRNMTIYLLIYQQWLMFATPSTLPI